MVAYSVFDFKFYAGVQQISRKRQNSILSSFCIFNFIFHYALASK